MEELPAIGLAGDHVALRPVLVEQFLITHRRAVICGADGFTDMEEFGLAKETWLRQFLELPNGVPSHDTFERVFAKLDPDAFADRFGRWMAGACEAAGLVHVAIDGKSARRAAKGTFTGCLHLVEAWAVENRLILGMRSVPERGRPGKSRAAASMTSAAIAR